MEGEVDDDDDDDDIMLDGGWKSVLFVLGLCWLNHVTCSPLILFLFLPLSCPSNFVSMSL